MKSEGMGLKSTVYVLVLVGVVAGARQVTVAARADAVEAVGMTVSDMDRAVEFFRKVLAFEKIGDVEIHGSEYEKLQGVFGLRMRVVRMRLGREIIELAQYLAPEGRPIPADWRSNDRAFQHIAVVVSDMDKAYRHLRAHKVRHASTGPQTIPASNPVAAGIRAFYFKDPDSHNLEIIYFPPGKGDLRWQQTSGRLFLGIDHTAIVVSDTARSLTFYRDWLGFKVAGESINHGIEQERLNNVAGARRVVGFAREPWPKWTFALEDGTKIEHEIFAVHGTPLTVLSWRLVDPQAKALLTVRPFLSGRDYHALHHENTAFRFDPEINGEQVLWHPYPDVAKISAAHNGSYRHQPDWYRNFVYEQERERGLDFTEDLAAPGSFEFDLTAGQAVLIFAAEGVSGTDIAAEHSTETLFVKLRARELSRRSAFATALDRAADSYLVRRGDGKTIVAGYPWFTDWGRDTFISLRGLCIATDRLDDARDILIEWASVVSEGMLPNLFPDSGDRPEYNSADASLWYIVAVHDFLSAAERCHVRLSQKQGSALKRAVDAILTGYAKGTRYAIRMGRDSLLAAGEPGLQLTWMDAKIGDWVVTPRIGKPVELQALWLNGLWIASHFNDRWREPLARGLEQFRRRFWHAQGGYFYDVVDVDHESGKLDARFRPNQIFAVGGLPLQIIDGIQAKQIVDAVERRLWTPLGLRSLAPGENGYTAHYRGGVAERDAGYHQGTVWPWLMGPFVEPGCEFTAGPTTP